MDQKKPIIELPVKQFSTVQGLHELLTNLLKSGVDPDHPIRIMQSMTGEILEVAEVRHIETVFLDGCDLEGPFEPHWKSYLETKPVEILLSNEFHRVVIGNEPPYAHGDVIAEGYSFIPRDCSPNRGTHG